MGYSPWGHRESDTTERLTHTMETILLFKTASVYAGMLFPMFASF